MARLSVRRVLMAAVIAGLVALPALAVGAHHRKLVVKLATVSSSGPAADGPSSTEGTEQLSADGHLYVFQSDSTNLPGGDPPGASAYLHNFKTGKTKLVGVDSHGNAPTGTAEYPEISANGRIISFNAVGLLGNDTVGEVYARNLKTGKTQLVSVTNAGDPATGNFSFLGSPSATGRYIAFESRAANMPGGDGTNGFAYLRDLKKHRTVLVSRNNAGDPVQGNPYGQSVSRDGRFVVFSSDDPNAVPAKAPPARHVYLRDLKKGKTTLIDKVGGVPVVAHSETPSITPDGRFIAYDSDATNLPGASGSVLRGYLFDRKTGKTRMVTRHSDGAKAGGGSVRISDDGKIITFESPDPALTHDSGGSRYQVFARNLKTGKTTMLSRTRKGKPGNGDSYYTSISADGRFASFEGYATNLGGDEHRTLGFRAGPIR